MTKVFIVGGDHLIENMFVKRGFTMVDNGEDADLLCFTGGADVCPVIYGEPIHEKTRYNLQRDQKEEHIFHKFYAKQKVGICRGAQFLNVMSGGSLWQDVDRHAIGGTHRIKYLDEGKYDYTIDADGDPVSNDGYTVHEVTSTHHQMMRPNKENSELWGFVNMSTIRDQGGQNKRRANFNYSPDVEIVYYHHTQSMCFQPHPEYGVEGCEDLFFTCLGRAFGEGVNYIKAAA